MVEYLDEAIRPLVLIMPKRNGYAKAFKIKEGHKDKDSELTSFRIDNEKLLEKYKAIWIKSEDLKHLK